MDAYRTLSVHRKVGGDPPRGVNGIFLYPLDANAVFDEIVLDPRVQDAAATELETELRAAGCTIPIQRSDLYTALTSLFEYSSWTPAEGRPVQASPAVAYCLQREPPCQRRSRPYQNRQNKK